MKRFLLLLPLAGLLMSCDAGSSSAYYRSPSEQNQQEWEWDRYEPIPREYDSDLADYTLDAEGKPSGEFREIIPGCAACGHRWEADPNTSVSWRRNPYRGRRFRNKVRNFVQGSQIGMDRYMNP